MLSYNSLPDTTFRFTTALLRLVKKSKRFNIEHIRQNCFSLFEMLTYKGTCHRMTDFRKTAAMRLPLSA